MDTKLNRFSHSIWTKALLFFIIIILFTNTLSNFIYLVEGQNGDLELILEKDYKNSNELKNLSWKMFDKINTLTFYYGDEERIKSGDALKQKHLKYRMEDEYYNNVRYDENGEPILSYEDFYEKNPEIVEKIKTRMIKEQLVNFKNISKSLKTDNKLKDISYYASNGTNVYSNSKNMKREDFEILPVYYIYSGMEETDFQGKSEYVYSDTVYLFDDYLEDELFPIEKREIYIGLSDDTFTKFENEWMEKREESRQIFIKIAIEFAVLLVVFIIYASLLGRRYWNDDEVMLNSFDRLFTDVNILICIGIITVWILFMSRIAFDNTYFGGYEIQSFVKYVTAILGSFGLIFVSSLIKHFKNRTLIKNSIIYNIFSAIITFFSNIFTSSSAGKKAVIVVVLYPIIVVMSLIFFPFVIAGAVWLTLKKVRKFEKIQKGTEKIRSGELDHKIIIDDKGELGKLANDINDISEGLEKAIDNELKSERMKSELITNVSHDIRTPLTSIITYIDLLKNEVDENKKNDYVDVLDNKSQRLKVLIDDLFEASKVSSGSIPVNLEKINLIDLLNQGIAEVEDKIEEKNLEFIVSKKSDDITVLADGDLLWRAIENLFSNIFKYSLENSRVYIDIKENRQNVFIIMKNISKYELNITEEELMERFKRGDESRTSDGSGLGLSITQSLIDLQKGEFKIEIDGDLFKTSIKLNKF